MARTKLKDRVLPDYTKGEEIFNMVSHIVGGAFAIAALVLCVIMGAFRGDGWSVTSGAIYGATMIVLYTMSSIYHGLTPPTAKKVFQIIDHCSIFLLIAGTYTPLALAGIRRENAAIGWIIFGVVWGCAVIGIVFNAIDLSGFKVFSMICYLAMGWCIVLVFGMTARILTAPGTALLLCGGGAYTIGAVLYGLGKRKRYIHSVFHLFVLAGSILHFFMILFYVMPLK